MAYDEESSNVIIKFRSDSGDCGEELNEIVVPRRTTKQTLQNILTILLKQEDEIIPYSFFIDDKEITKDIEELLGEDHSCEKQLIVKYQPQAVFKVQAVTRCTSSLPGHAKRVLCASFSPNGEYLASGSEDKTVRFWDINTQTPHFTGRGHIDNVLVLSWSPDGCKLASGCEKGYISIWDPSTGRQLGKSFKIHNKWIAALCWEPLHLSSDGKSNKLASAGKDGSIRIWNVNYGTCSISLSGHKLCVTALRWSGQKGQDGQGYIYSASQDKTVKVWRASDGVLCRTLEGHGHWVNTIALNTDYVLRTGANDPQELMKVKPEYASENEQKSRALERYNTCLKLAGGKEMMVSGSDDFTLILWTPETEKKPIARMTGHQQLVNDVKFSPDTRYIASASFDKSIRLWSGTDGAFITTFRGHVSGVYQLAWSADSRLFVSGSKDSTLKVWSVTSRSLLRDLPGHADEVYAVDWSPDGQKVVSGGKDKILKLWST